MVGADPVTSVDITAADMLMKLDDTLRATGIDLCLAETRFPSRTNSSALGCTRGLGAERFFSTISKAVGGYLKTHRVQWLDWEDRRQ